MAVTIPASACWAPQPGNGAPVSQVAPAKPSAQVQPQVPSRTVPVLVPEFWHSLGLGHGVSSVQVVPCQPVVHEQVHVATRSPDTTPLFWQKSDAHEIAAGRGVTQ